MSEKILVDPQGREIAAKYVKPYLRKRDAFVRRMHKKAAKLNAQLEEFRDELADGVETFIDNAAKREGVKLGGKKGNVTLTSFDGLVELHRSVQESLIFDERLQLARACIDNAIADLCKGVNPSLMQLVKRAWKTDTDGNLRRSHIAALLRLDIRHDEWRKGCDLIRESMTVATSKHQYRFYVRPERGASKRLVSLNMSSLGE